MSGLHIRLADQIVIGLGFVLLLVIGAVCSRRSQTDEGYFLAGRSMPGWVVGFSLMATIVSSMTFLAVPAFAFGDGNWRNCLAHFTYIPAIVGPSVARSERITPWVIGDNLPRRRAQARPQPDSQLCLLQASVHAATGAWAECC